MALLASSLALSFQSSRHYPAQKASYAKFSSRSFVETEQLRRAELDTQAGSKLGGSQLIRRSEGSVAGDLCGLPADKVLSVNPQIFGETAEGLQASWAGKDRLLIVASNDKKTTVWRGNVVGHGIFRFDKDDSLIGEPVSPISLRVSTVDPNIATIVSSSKQYMFSSIDAGHSWRRGKLPTASFAPQSDIFLSHNVANTLALLSTAGELYITSNLGTSWSRLASDVKTISFASGPTQSSMEYIFYSIGGSLPVFNPLYRYCTATHKTEAIDLTAFKFNIDERFLYVSRQNYTGNMLDSLTRRLYVSSNYDASDASKVYFTEVQLPSLKPQELFVVMATHEAGAFIHVSDNAGVPYGRLFMSDSSGARFSLSMDNHLYHVMDSGVAMMSVDDFYEVKSARGVYISTAVIPHVGHVSMITYNNGGQWQRIKAPEGSGCALPKCSLHIHIRFSHLIGAFYDIPSLVQPFSTSAANGIIIAHGSIGAVRNDSSPHLYVSNDGGHTWLDPGLPAGSYVYGVADYGNVMAVIPNEDVVEHIWFSHDLGRCFRRELLDSSSVFRQARGLMVDPSAASLYAFVLGVEGLGEDDMWRMVTINFGSLLDSKCQESDYENITEPVCLLGYQNVYNSTKPSSVCYNEEGYKSSSIARIPCKCSTEDLECDFDFFNNGSGCSKLGDISLASLCPPGVTSYNESNSGYRLITGDQCVMTVETADLIKQVERPCTAHELEAGFFTVHRKVGHVVVGVVIVAAIIGVAIVSLFIFIRFYNRRSIMKEQVRYKRVPLTDHYGDEDSNDDNQVT